jgi:putative endonuclease
VTKGGYVYIPTNRPRGTLYIGVTANLERRLSEHRLGVGSKFTHRYNLHLLVHYEAFDEIEYAIAREKQLKAWRRDWKIELVEKGNRDWGDLSEGWWAPEALPALQTASS